MRPLTRPGLVLAIAVAVFALPTIASGALSGPTAPAANSTTYQDTIGEDPAAPDIRTITVSNDDTGLISFRLNIPNRQQLSRDLILLLWVDSDNNVQTGATGESGDPPGTDYVIEIVRGEPALYRWDGTNFTRRFGDPSAVTLSASWSGGPVIRISASELGNTKQLRFYVLVVSGIEFDPTTDEPLCPTSPTPCPADDAPGGGAGLYPYQVVIAKPSLVVKRVSATKPTAGKPFTLRMVAARSDTGATVQNGRVTCVGRVGNQRLQAKVQRVVAGAATCTWNLPASAKGKRFRGSVALAFEGLRVTESYTSRIG